MSKILDAQRDHERIIIKKSLIGYTLDWYIGGELKKRMKAFKQKCKQTPNCNIYYPINSLNVESLIVYEDRGIAYFTVDEINYEFYF
jgi:hypothetical protein